MVRSCGAAPLSDVLRVTCFSMSELFKVATTNGWYYLKAPPPGCAEVAATAAIARLFPKYTLDVSGTCSELHCFVAKGFRHVDYGDVDQELAAVRQLAALQLEAVDHLDALRRAGIPDCSPSLLLPRLDEWAALPVAVSTLQANGMSSALWRDALREVCARLSASVVPTTLVHGDFAPSNAAVRDDVAGEQGRVILFDWQFSYLSHSFCDFATRPEWSPQAVSEYLGMWSSFVGAERTRRELNLAVALGWMARLDWVLRVYPLLRGVRIRSGKRLLSQCATGLVGFVQEWKSGSLKRA
eukprot:TRINITY_DN5403_c0_g1_i1.p1 TRINITY_DN5403_c0_g1~~TRINITY_DN5403_c0_g1_i1.p1  ORF type:complete len:298 (+),score=42.63 TRINITY_DN5403_c0_g1_i1:605-1498(+)